MLSIFLSLCGLYSLATGKLPAILSGGKGYRVEGSGARMVGAVLAMSYLLGLAIRAALSVSFGQDVQIFGSAIEIVVFVVVASVALALSRRVRRRA